MTPVTATKITAENLLEAHPDAIGARVDLPEDSFHLVPAHLVTLLLRLRDPGRSAADHAHAHMIAEDYRGEGEELVDVARDENGVPLALFPSLRTGRSLRWVVAAPITP